MVLIRLIDRDSHLCCRPHLGRGRYIAAGQRIHSSVRRVAEYEKANNAKYKPRATLTRLDKSNEQTQKMKSIWSKLDELNVDGLPDWVEPDLEDLARELVLMLKTHKSLADLERRDAFLRRMQPLHSSRQFFPQT